MYMGLGLGLGGNILLIWIDQREWGRGEELSLFHLVFKNLKNRGID